MKEYIKFYPANSGKFKDKTIVTVFTIRDGDNFGRGVSICAANDEFNADTGMFHAKNYAMRGVKGRANILIADERAIRELLKTNCPFVFHSQALDPFFDLTWQERRFLFGKKNYLKKYIVDDNKACNSKMIISVAKARRLGKTIIQHFPNADLTTYERWMEK